MGILQSLLNKKSRDGFTCFIKPIKLLLAGDDKSGKDIVAAQIRTLFGDFSNEELQSYRHFVHFSVIRSVVLLLDTMEENAPDTTDTRRLRSFCVKTSERNVEISPEIKKALKRVWADGVMQSNFDSFKSNLCDSQICLLENFDRIFNPSYIPTKEDVVSIGKTKTNITETYFKARDLDFMLLEARGARGARKEWLESMSHVDAIVFCPYLAAYDEYAEEGNNAMQGSLSLFEIICKFPLLSNTSIIFLLLTKKDIFAEKISHSPLTICFPDYSGAMTYEEASVFIRRKFEEVNIHAKKKRDLRMHYISAVDTSNLRFFFSSMFDDVLHNILKSR